MSTEKHIVDQVDVYCKSLGIKYIGKNDQRNHARSGDDGRPDRIYLLPKGQTLLIEFKTPEKMKAKDNSLRPKQVEWRRYLVKNDHNYYLLDNAKEAIDIINRYI